MRKIKKLPFPFSERIGGLKKWKKRKGKFFVLRTAERSGAVGAESYRIIGA